MLFREASRDTRTTETRLPAHAAPEPVAALSDVLDRCVAEEIITPEQAARIRRLQGSGVRGVAAEQPSGNRRSSLVVEGLGYLGGAIVVASSMLIAAQYWGDLASAFRLSLLAVAALTLLVSGAAVPASLAAVGDRLRAVLWFGSTAAAAGLLTVLAVDLLDLRGSDITAFVASGTAAYAGALWFRRPSVLQQLAMMVALGAAASALIAQAPVPDTAPGLGAWGVGLCWALLGWRGVLEPHWFAMVLGSSMAIVGAMVTADSDAGVAITLLTVVAVVTAAMTLRNLPLLGVGTVGLLVNLPAAITRWFPDSPAVPYVLLVVGLMVVVAAVWIGRRPPPPRPEHREELT